MKKIFVLFLLAFCAKLVFAQNSLSLDESIEDAAAFLEARIPSGTSVAVFNFSASTTKLSEHIVNELTIALTNMGMNIYDRNNLDEVNREIYYGFTGAVNDDSAAKYGQDVGVQTVILGELTKSGDTEYRLRIQAIVSVAGGYDSYYSTYLEEFRRPGSIMMIGGGVGFAENAPEAFISTGFIKSLIADEAFIKWLFAGTIIVRNLIRSEAINPATGDPFFRLWANGLFEAMNARIKGSSEVQSYTDSMYLL